MSFEKENGSDQNNPNYRPNDNCNVMIYLCLSLFIQVYRGLFSLNNVHNLEPHPN